jgi:formylglycine-generating enzyme required for sulfatase activity
MGLVVGDLVGGGRFRIDGALGGDGAFRLLLALELASEQPMLLMVFDAETSADPAVRARLTADPRKAPRGSGLAKVSAVFEEAGELLVACERPEGGPLAEVVDAELDFEELCELFQEILAGLAPLHKAGRSHGALGLGTIWVDAGFVCALPGFGGLGPQPAPVVADLRALAALLWRFRTGEASPPSEVTETDLMLFGPQLGPLLGSLLAGHDEAASAIQPSALLKALRHAELPEDDDDEDAEDEEAGEEDADADDEDADADEQEDEDDEDEDEQEDEDDEDDEDEEAGEEDDEGEEDEEDDDEDVEQDAEDGEGQARDEGREGRAARQPSNAPPSVWRDLSVGVLAVAAILLVAWKLGVFSDAGAAPEGVAALTSVSAPPAGSVHPQPVAAATPEANVHSATPPHPEPPPPEPPKLRVFPDGFVRIEPGRFTMGSPASEADRDSDETQHEVTITRAFWLGKYEVTQAEWEAEFGSNPAFFPGCPTCPVEMVSWFDAARFANARSRKEGLEVCYEDTVVRDAQGQEQVVLARLTGLACKGYRLPTEAEWEYAARAGSTESRYGAVDEIGWYGGALTKQPLMARSGWAALPAGKKLANAWGLHDMLGNVWEWTHDWYGTYGLQTATDPTGPYDGAGRVLRGGDWESLSGSLRAANRFEASPERRNRFTGFRLARGGGLDDLSLNERPLEPKVVESTPQVSGELDAKTVQQYIRRQLAGVKACYEVRLEQNRALAGEVTLAFTILPNGGVAIPATRNSTLGDGDLEGCIRIKMSRWKFPSPKDGGVVEVAYPLILKSQ